MYLPNGDSTAPAHEVTYLELLRKVTQAANAFHALGVGSNDVVSYVLPNLLETHYTIWGGEAAGIVNAVNPLLDPDHIAHILNEVQTKVLVTVGPTLGAALWEKVDAVRSRVPSLRAVLVVGEDQPLAPGVLPFAAELARQPGDRLVSGRRIERHDIASCFHTGGTTGLPKVAQHTHLNELADGWSGAVMLGLSARDTLLCGLPLFHVNGVVVTGVVPFLVGAKVVLLGAEGYRSKTAIAHFWRNVERFRASFFSAVPTVYSSLLGVPIDGADVSSLRYAICGAAPMPPELIRKFEDATGVKILEGYGLTEGTCVSAVNPRDGVRPVGSIGLRIPYQQMKAVVLDPDGRCARDCAVDEIGHLVIKGPNVFPGYKDENANRGIWIGDGWLNTGDLARQDADGRFWLTGRQKDLIIRGGHNLDPSHDRGSDDAASGRAAGGGCRQAGCVCRRASRGLRDPAAGPERNCGRAVAAREVDDTRARGRPERGDHPRGDSGHRSREDLQAGASLRRREARARGRLARRRRRRDVRGVGRRRCAARYARPRARHAAGEPARARSTPPSARRSTASVSATKSLGRSHSHDDVHPARRSADDQDRRYRLPSFQPARPRRAPSATSSTSA